MIKSIYVFVLVSFLFSSVTNAQIGECGTSFETQRELLSQRFSLSKSRNNITYVPLRFTVFRNDDATGGPTIANLLDQFTVVNNDFKGMNLQFYLADGPNFNFINNTNVTTDPPAFNSFLVSQRNTSAVNVYITKFARNPSSGVGVVLGYYTGGGDYIVVIDTEIAKKTSTVSHEIGHYFSLAHTFFGWENDPYDEAKHGNPLTVTSAGGQSVETMNKTNCTFAADQICDTPPDYNFGFGASSCNFNRIVRDRNGDTVRTQVNNQMGYFNNCASYQFTQGQNDRMNSSLFSSSRFSLRKNYTPVNTPITANLIVNFPKGNTTVQSFNNVAFDWENIPNAQYYLFTVSDGRNTTSLVTTQSELTLKDLKANSTYFFTVRPFSEGFTDTRSVTTLFRTGNIMTSVESVENPNSLNIFPNPINDKLSGVTFKLKSNNSKKVQIKIIDGTGRLISESNHSIQSGENNINYSTSSMAKGIYFVRVTGEQIDIQSKFVVLD